MFWGLLIFAIVAAAVFASSIFWEWLTGIALFSLVVSIAQLDPAMILTSALLFAVCCWRWVRFPA